MYWGRNLKFSSEYKDEIIQILYFGYWDSLFYNKKKINDTLIILKIVQIPRKRVLISCLRIALPNKTLIENINVLKAEIDQEYTEDSNNLFENIKWELISKINQNIKDNKQLDTDTYIIKDFP